MVTARRDPKRAQATRRVNNAGDSVYVNWEGAGGHDVGDSITITFSVGNPVSAVPEPSTWAMMLIGFCGLSSSQTFAQEVEGAIRR
jgi:hypothetical protein